VLPGVEAPRRGRGGARDGRNITDLLKPGQEIVVQVVKDPLKTKGARLSMDLTIAGRYMVYAPYGEGVGISRRLDEKERERLRKEAAKLDLKGAGAIIRTAAQGGKRADLERKEDLLKRINQAAKVLPLEQLALSPQCGFASTMEGNLLTEADQWAKLHLVVDAAREVWG